MFLTIDIYKKNEGYNFKLYLKIVYSIKINIRYIIKLIYVWHKIEKFRIFINIRMFCLYRLFKDDDDYTRPVYLLFYMSVKEIANYFLYRHNNIMVM